MENDQTQSNPTTIPVTPPSPPIIDPHDVKPKFPLISVIMGLVILILVAVVGFLVYQNMQMQKQIANVNTVVQTPVPYVSPSPYATATASATPTASTTTQGTITGSICYPSSGIPAGKVVAKNTATNTLTSFDNAANNSSFSVNLPIGQYKLRYEPTTYPTVIGYYTSCTGSEPSCQDNTKKRASIITTVTLGQTAQGVKLCDYYYQAGMEPDF